MGPDGEERSVIRDIKLLPVLYENEIEEYTDEEFTDDCFCGKCFENQHSYMYN